MILDQDKTFDFKQKVGNDFPNFVNSVDHLQINELDANLESYAKYLEEILYELKYNPKIVEGAALVTKLNKPYNTKINFYKGKTRELNKFIDDGIADKVALKKALVDYNKMALREEFKRDQDEELKTAKSDLTELRAGFNDGKRAVTAKIKYINILILEKDPEQGFETEEDRAELITPVVPVPEVSGS